MASAKINEERGQFEVTIDGKVHCGWTTNNALRLYAYDNGVSLDKVNELLQTDHVTAISEIAYYSCVNYAARKNTKFGLKKDFFISYLLDEMEVFAKIADTILKSLSPQELEEEKK